MTDLVMTSVITCPHCHTQTTQRMPVASCDIVFNCPNCGEWLRPKPGDCCIYCSYGSQQCPPRQIEEGRGKAELPHAPLCAASRGSSADNTLLAPNATAGQTERSGLTLELFCKWLNDPSILAYFEAELGTKGKRAVLIAAFPNVDPDIVDSLLDGD